MSAKQLALEQLLRLSPHLLGVLLTVFRLEEGKALGQRGCQRFVERRGLSGATEVSDCMYVAGVCEARCTNVDHQGYRGLLCGGGEVLQPVKAEGVALFDL
jgi:hypothetical protein